MTTTYKALHLFCGIGGGALGFQEAREEYRGVVGRIETIVGIDNDPEACEDFEIITGAPSVQMDLFSKGQYVDFHGEEPGTDWNEVKPSDLLDATDGVYPDIVFTSAPCKSFSGLLGKDRAKTRKYRALSKLTIRGIKLTLEAFEDDLPSLILFENVPRITTRGKDLLDKIKKLLKRHGYEVSDGFHDCGSIGGLAQTRKRYLLIARNARKVDSFVYHPPSKPMKAVGDVLESLPIPDGVAGGKMHKVPRLQLKTWIRLALIRPGKDWRDLESVDYEKYGLVPLSTGFKSGTHGTIYKVSRWNEPANTVTGSFRPNNGAICINDPRLGCRPRSGTYGVLAWDQVASTVTGSADVHASTCAVADPRIPRLNESGNWIILSEDGNWHRPLTTLELAALQGFPTSINGRPLELSGKSEQRWRERIGNAVPPAAARAIAETMLRTLLATRQTDWLMSSEEIWVQPIKDELEATRATG
ncbi:site-specific DNA-cytosine methylase [Croceifilum oryzae]|uniref:DNA (cytosine-5-)-methyltransferase n=1 Tax=Croceifilum oryzae TaxID=1553429 RepID=A0AAJ1TMN7_9BACL|nr:DNA cytosine methyltransferase [Croceifilum oryzae]MDQ0418731.1 site-specific DNA-cytosine methylase [Croceifilum oryzae]